MKNVPFFLVHHQREITGNVDMVPIIYGTEFNDLKNQRFFGINKADDHRYQQKPAILILV